MNTLSTVVRTHPARVLWALMALSVSTWALHLVYSASVVHFTCTHPEWRWTLYAITPVTAAPLLVAWWVAARTGREVRVTTRNDSGLAFLSKIAIGVIVANLVLILAEGIMVPWLSSCA